MNGKEDLNYGPILRGLFGRKAGDTKYKCSPALKNSGIIWTRKHFASYMTNPKKYILG